MQIIKSAIQDRQRLQFIYKGHIRIVEPHAYGATKKGSDVLRAYQVAGGRWSLLYAWSKLVALIYCLQNAKRNIA